MPLQTSNCKHLNALQSFTKLLQATYPDYVRLSIHESTGAVKLSVPLIIQGSGEFPRRTPWHSTIALSLSGTYSTTHAMEVRDTHNLILRDDGSLRPFYYREKSELWDWADDIVVFEPRYSNRLVVRPKEGVDGREIVLSEEQIEKIRKLRAIHTAGPVEVVGFANTTAAEAAKY
ncbi:hypothetical protein K469DRAFT_765861 [Zopfia rhizophila CBS 207.26]|uniref:Uncharacterized protein n=1 Tax=Zopfia rhizophila CBS 207.26 TaxID=1314779 RepID=A0A6A6EAJ3_9PEZI|nr:hypothetical protein K469DRAFT_765861 [Zopfia rhizophila CBS 207.26]